MIADLRSDTITKPTAEMLQTMMEAKVGDDVFGEDETINKLELKAKAIFGFESAMFCPTATMCNQIAIKLHTKPMDEIICDKTAHIFNYEVGGAAFHSGCQVRLLNGHRGIFQATDILNNINPEDVHKTISKLVCIENTSNRGGGKIYPLSAIQKIKKVCDAHALKLHLDGSRIFNALIETKDDAKKYVTIFDSITICLSKGLGCPAGALLLIKKEQEQEARRIRKAFGGGMRQAGFLAAAGIYALDHHVEKLKTDHLHAKLLEKQLLKCSFVENVLQVETNIVIFTLNKKIKNDHFIKKLAKQNVKAFTVSENGIRFVTHLDVSREMIDYTNSVLKKLSR